MSDHLQRSNALSMDKSEFIRIGHALVNSLAEFYETIGNRPVTTNASNEDIRTLLGSEQLPEEGSSPEKLMAKAASLLTNHSLLNGHPKFMGFVTSSPTQIGALADLLASAVNANVGANILSPMATAIETQTVKWLAECIGLGPGYGGLLVSGGNMANFTAFVAARTAKAPPELKELGLAGISQKMVFYASRATHTWVEKATLIFGNGSRSLRWINVHPDHTMDTEELEKAIQADLAEGLLPFMAIGNAGDVSMGAVDNLKTIGQICHTYGLWFHIDGAYGIPASMLPEYKGLFDGMDAADSIALDPHKWLYAPLEAGCILVRDPAHLLHSFSSHPVYYNFDSSDGDTTVNYYEYGFQNSRYFRALKVWLGLQQAGRSGFTQLIREDIALAALLYELVDAHPELEAFSCQLSITTFRYVPFRESTSAQPDEAYLNALNERLLNHLQQSGHVFLSDAIVHHAYCLRACIVNYRTTEKDIHEVVEIIVTEGRKMAESFMPGL